MSLQDKFRLLLFTLKNSNPLMRLQLLNGSIEPKKFVSMEEADLIDDETRRIKEEQAAYELQAKRTDGFLEKELNRKDKVKGMYICRKCKSDNVN